MMLFRLKIIKKAGELFFANGIRDVSMDMIAKEMNISKKTIYGYFKNKDSLIKEAGKMALEEQTRLNNRIPGESENVIEAILTFMKHGTALLDKTNPLYFKDLQRLYPKIWKESIQQGKKHSYGFIAGLLKKGREEGIYREEIKVKLITWTLIEQLYHITNQQVFPSSQFTMSEAYKNIIICMTRGIVTREGLEILERYLALPEDPG